jgi:hypothetical protein
MRAEATVRKGSNLAFRGKGGKVRNRRYLAVAARFGGGPFTYPLQTPNVPYGQAGENATRFPHLAHRSAAAHKLHGTPQQDSMKLISGNLETSSRLPAFSLFLPGRCPNTRDRRSPCAVTLRLRGHIFGNAPNKPLRG